MKVRVPESAGQYFCSLKKKYLEMQMMNLQFVLECRIGGRDVRLEFSTIRVIRKESLAYLPKERVYCHRAGPRGPRGPCAGSGACTHSCPPSSAW